MYCPKDKPCTIWGDSANYYGRIRNECTFNRKLYANMDSKQANMIASLFHEIDFRKKESCFMPDVFHNSVHFISFYNRQN